MRQVQDASYGRQGLRLQSTCPVISEQVSLSSSYALNRTHKDLQHGFYCACLSLLQKEAAALVPGLYSCVLLKFRDPTATFTAVLNGAEKLRGRQVLELGSGTGIGGIAAALLGAQVVLTDRADTLPLLQRNVHLHAEAISQAGGRFFLICLLTLGMHSKPCSANLICLLCRGFYTGGGAQLGVSNGGYMQRPIQLDNRSRPGVCGSRCPAIVGYCECSAASQPNLCAAHGALCTEQNSG